MKIRVDCKAPFTRLFYLFGHKHILLTTQFLTGLYDSNRTKYIGDWNKFVLCLRLPLANNFRLCNLSDQPQPLSVVNIF